jgi:hypothetical protein
MLLMHRVISMTRAHVIAAMWVGSLALGACGGASARTTAAERAAIADTIKRTVSDAYDFSRPDVLRRLMSLYPDSGRVVSAAAGRIIASRDSLERELRYFWESTGQNMQSPTLEWGPVYVDVLTPSAAVATWTYRIPHRTPTGSPHTIAGAWTALFVRRGGRWVIIQEHLSELPSPQLPQLGG